MGIEFDQVSIVGCGYVGRRVAHRWLKHGKPVAALTRTDIRATELANLGIQPVLGDLDDVQTLQGVRPGNALIYYFVPPRAAGVVDTRMSAFISILDAQTRPAGIVLMSTTGVYGDHAGAWINESAELRPNTDQARRRLHAEQTLQRWGQTHDVPIMVLRVGGIYGPERLPIARIRSAEPIVREAECPYTNRIHIDDLVAACAAAARRGKAGEIYNVCDGHPGTMAQYFNAVADAMGLSRPPAISLQQAQTRLSPGMLSYLTESRRLDNRKLLEQLGVRLKYPTLESGLAALKLRMIC